MRHGYPVDDPSMVIPYVTEQSPRGERTMDIYSRLLSDRIIFLGTPVTDQVANVVMAQLLHLDSEDPEQDINIYINSPGGSVYAGMAIYDTMRFVNCDVATTALGMAASMGAFLLAAGTKGKRSALPNTRVLLHQPSIGGGLGGQVSDVEIHARERLDGMDAWELVGPGRGASRVLRAGEMSAAARAAWRERRVRSVLVLPLVASGEEIGQLALALRERRFPRSAVRSYQTVAAQAALALENLRLVGEARRAGRQAGVLRERQRMAHEIHDTLAQGFTSIVMNLEAAESVMSREEEPGRVHRHIDQARLTARESLTEARRLVWALRPERLEEATLPEALVGLAERWTEESGIPASVATTGTPRPLPSGAEAALFRVAQEALANVRKHAQGASRVALTLSYMGDAVALDARDDGAGFDPAGEAGKARDRDSGGFGLRGMRERVEGIGGTLSVESAPGEGTTLAVELPVGPAGDGREAP